MKMREMSESEWEDSSTYTIDGEETRNTTWMKEKISNFS